MINSSISLCQRLYKKNAIPWHIYAFSEKHDILNQSLTYPMILVKAFSILLAITLVSSLHSIKTSGVKFHLRICLGSFWGIREPHSLDWSTASKTERKSGNLLTVRFAAWARKIGRTQLRNPLYMEFWIFLKSFTALRHSASVIGRSHYCSSSSDKGVTNSVFRKLPPWRMSSSLSLHW